MANDRNDQPNSSDLDLTLDEILAEFSSSRPREGDAAAPKKGIPVTREAAPKEPAPPAPKRPAPEPSAKPEPTDEKIIRFPGPKKTAEPTPEQDAVSSPAKPEAGKPEEDSFLTRILKKADAYSAHMFEDAEPTPEEQKAQRYVPGVDEERPPQQRKAPARPRGCTARAQAAPCPPRRLRQGCGQSPLLSLFCRFSRGPESASAQRFPP